MQRSSSQFKNSNQLPFNRNRQNGTDKPSSDVLALREDTNRQMFYFGEIPSHLDLGPPMFPIVANKSFGALSTFHPGQPQPQDENRSRSSSLSSTSSSGLEELLFELEL